MNSLQRFLAHAQAFEETYVDDDWSRLEPFMAPDVVYRAQLRVRRDALRSRIGMRRVTEAENVGREVVEVTRETLEPRFPVRERGHTRSGAVQPERRLAVQFPLSLRRRRGSPTVTSRVVIELRTAFSRG